MSTLDPRTLATCIVALRVREDECKVRGLSTQHWAEAKRHVKRALLDCAADDIKSQTPAMLRRQAD